MHRFVVDGAYIVTQVFIVIAGKALQGAGLYLRSAAIHPHGKVEIVAIQGVIALFILNSHHIGIFGQIVRNIELAEASIMHFFSIFHRQLCVLSGVHPHGLVRIGDAAIHDSITGKILSIHAAKDLRATGY